MEEKKRKTNSEKMREICQHKPSLIFFDVETTGIMNGNDNHITQLAMTAYNYNSSNGRYELQDNIFMLAKAHPDTLHNIEVKGAPTKENASRILRNEYVDAYRQEITRGYTNISNRIKTLNKKIEKRTEQIENCTERQVKKKEGYEADLVRYKNNLAAERAALHEFEKLHSFVFDKDDKPIEFGECTEQEIDKLIDSIRTDAFIKERGNVFPTNGVIAGYYTFKQNSFPNTFRNVSDYVDARLEDKIRILETEKLDKVLSVQGIDKGKWIKEGLGLTIGEIQVGINEFLSKYDSDNFYPAVYITNGTYYAKHYLAKDGLSIVDTTKRDVFDLYQNEKWQSDSENKWTANVGTFAKMYEQRTGKTIKTFDAFTKALCYAEMTSEIMNGEVYRAGIPFVNRSVNQLANAVAEKVASMDEDYVMSATRASALNWRIATQYEFEHSDYKFNNLDYVDFGTERKYVDIDKLFEVNKNFEVTLEGEKEPIKNWEELENKIKALNANISEGLLEQIKCKYEEIEIQAQEQKEAFYESEVSPSVVSSKPAANSPLEQSADNPSSELEQKLSKILSDFENRYEKVTAEMEDAQAELDKIQNHINLTKPISEDLEAIGNFIKAVHVKTGDLNNPTNKVICSVEQSKTDICLFDTQLDSNSLKFKVPKINIELSYFDKWLIEIKIAYTETGTERPFDRDYDRYYGGFYMSLDLTKNTLDFTEGEESTLIEFAEKWDCFKQRIINGCQEELDKKIIAQQDKTQNIKDKIKKIKSIERD